MGDIQMRKVLILFFVLGTLTFSKSKIECNQIYWKDMDKFDKTIYLILKKYNNGREPTIKECVKKEVEIKNNKEIKNGK